MRQLLFISLLYTAINIISISYADEWYQAAPLHIPRGGAAAVTHQGYIYVFGGMSIDNKVLNNAERYDLVNDSWDTTFVPDFEYARFNASAVLFNDKIYLMGGQDGDRILKEVEVYDPVQNSWSHAHDLRKEREGLTGAVFNDRIYAIGGQGDSYHLIDEIEWYDDPADNWLEAIFNLPYPRAAHFSSVEGNTFYMFGGYYYELTSAAYKASPGSSGYQWTSVGALSKSRAYGATTRVYHEIYMIGGETAYGKTSEAEVFNTQSELFGPCEPISSPRSGMCAVTALDTFIYVIGGFETDLDEPVATVEYYHGELTTTAIADKDVIFPEHELLVAGYPNPFNNRINFDLSIPQKDEYELSVYNIKGQKIKDIFLGTIPKGSARYFWQVDNETASGLYFLTVRSNSHSKQVKMVYIK